MVQNHLLGRRLLRAAALGILPLAAALHALILVLFAFAERLRVDAATLAFSYVIYPLLVSMAIYRLIKKQALPRVVPADDKAADKSLGEADFPRESSNTFSLYFGTITCAVLAWGAVWREQAMAGFFYADFMAAAMGALLYRPMDRLNEYVLYAADRLLTPLVARRVFRYHHRRLWMVILLTAAFSVGTYVYWVMRPTAPYTYAISQDASETLIEIIPTPEPVSNTPKPDNSRVHEKHYYPEYVFQSEVSPPFRPIVRFVFLLGVVVSVLAAVLVYRSWAGRKNNNASEWFRVEKIKRGRGRSNIFRRPAAWLSVNARIRRLFYLKVKTHIKTGLRVYPSSTSVTLAQDIEKKEDIAALEMLYRSARYGGQALDKTCEEAAKHAFRSGKLL